VQIIEATAFGVRAAAIRLRSRDTPMTFVIYPMIHMGSRKFYADVAARLKTADVIVAEGVGRGSKRRPSVLAAALTLSYSVMRFNRRLDVVEQDSPRRVYASSGTPRNGMAP
jgi:hypothetical protein